MIASMDKRNTHVHGFACKNCVREIEIESKGYVNVKKKRWKEKRRRWEEWKKMVRECVKILTQLKYLLYYSNTNWVVSNFRFLFFSFDCLMQIWTLMLLRLVSTLIHCMHNGIAYVCRMESAAVCTLCLLRWIPPLETMNFF